MMIRTLATALFLVPLYAVAEVPAPHVSPPTGLDGAWVQLPADMPMAQDTMMAVTPSQADIVAMADLDGDPSIITAKEREMIAVLGQLLGSQPITW